MFKRKQNSNEYAGLKDEIERLLSDLENYDPSDDEYIKIVDRIIKLDSMNHTVVEKKELSKDAILGAVVSVLGILLVINTERVGAITSKAFSLIRKA